MEQKLKRVRTKMNEMIAWETYKRGLMEAIETVKEQIKLKTEEEHIALKEHRKNLNVATWKIDQLFKDINEKVEAEGELETTLTLDDFAENTHIDVELARGEMKEAMKEKDE